MTMKQDLKGTVAQAPVVAENPAVAANPAAAGLVPAAATRAAAGLVPAAANPAAATPAAAAAARPLAVAQTRLIRRTRQRPRPAPPGRLRRSDPLLIQHGQRRRSAALSFAFR